MSFTIEQIQAAHTKVKSGADFPVYIQELKAMGVLSYNNYVSDGHTDYTGANGELLKGKEKYAAMEIAACASIEQLKKDLLAHQQGQTDYPSFCKQAAAAGVEKWTVHLLQLTCTYYDKAGNPMLEEAIPIPGGS